MSVFRRRGLSPLVLAVVLAGCTPIGAPALKGDSPRTPMRWIVVEKRFGELVKDGIVGDGQVDPNAMVLAMEPLYAEDARWEVHVEARDYFVELLEILPGRTVAPGETVTVRVRVGNACPEGSYCLSAAPTSPDVRLIGMSREIVHGKGDAVFRFTSLTGGRCGIAVRAERSDP